MCVCFQSFSDVTGMWPKGMMAMLQKLDLKHEGRHHSGIGNKIIDNYEV